MLSFAIALNFVLSARADEMVTWYGRITIEQTRHIETNDTYLPGHAYGPGQRKVVDDQTWIGTIEYLPNNQTVISGTYRANYSDVRNTQRSIRCNGGYDSSYRDFESHERHSTVTGSVTNTGRLDVYIGDDGAYRINAGIQLPPALNGNQISDLRETFNGCDRNPTRRTAQSGTAIAPFMPFTAMARATAPTPHPDTLEGESETMFPPQPNTTTKISWSLRRAVDRAMARISAPASFTRGDTVTLDGSGSLGDLRKYEWRFAYGANCAPAIPRDPELVIEGPRITFKALCDFRASLSVEDSLGQGDRTSSAWIRVVPRRGDLWKTKFASRPGPDLTERLMPEFMRLGVNQCAQHAADAATGHFIHTSAANNGTWIDDGYETEEVTDAGPFGGMWWVSNNKLEIDRLERVNRNLTAGEAHDINRAHGTLANFLLLKPQVQAHEAMHSTLAKEAIERDDPALKVEAVLGGSRAMIQTFADMAIRDAEQSVLEATSDANVGSRLRSNAALNRSVNIWLPDTSGNERAITLGPLWSLGE